MTFLENYTIKKVVDHVTNPQHIDVDALVIHCFDPRFEDAHNMFKKLFGKVDTVCVAGGAKHFTQPDSIGFQFMTNQVDISLALHNPKKIVLSIHESCGAYKGSIPNDAAENEFLADQIDIAVKNLKTYLVEKGHNLPIERHIAGFDGVMHLEPIQLASLN